MPDFNLNRAHDRCRQNRDVLARSRTCGCFYCLAIFSPAEIESWIDEPPHNPGQTATCPHCGIDSVIGDAIGLTIDEAFLRAMHDRWFS